MKKLRLEDLAVESFGTTGTAEQERGTVRGHSGASYVECTRDTCGPFTCSGSYDYTFCDCNTLNNFTCPDNC